MSAIKLTGLCLILAMQACATHQESVAPPAPCASTQKDCGPARPLNWAIADARTSVHAQVS